MKTLMIGLFINWNLFMVSLAHDILVDARFYGCVSGRHARAHAYHGISYSKWRLDEWQFNRTDEWCGLFRTIK